MRLLIILITLISTIYVDSLLSQVWTPQTSGVNNELYSVHFVNQNVGWAVGGSGKIIKTTNSGNTWVSQNSNTNLYLFGVHFFDVNTGWVCGDNPGTILKTTDGGTNWNQLTSNTSNELYSIKFINGNIGWTCGQNGTILKTSNGGSSWSSQLSGTNSYLHSIFFMNELEGWASGTQGVILKTTNGGSSWFTLNSGISEVIYSVFFINSNNGWAVGEGETKLKTTDGGNTWAIQTLGTSIYLSNIYFIDSNNGWAVGSSGKIIKTTNGGNTWIDELSNTLDILLGLNFVNANNGWAVGVSGTILKYSIPNSINISSLSQTNYCQNSSLQVPYTLIGSYNNGNTFTAQLSDANGSFNSPTSIGSIESINSGTINVKIPNNAIVGTNYRLRVVSSNPVTISNDNGANLTINSLPLAYNLTGGGVFCENDIISPLILSNSSLGVSYQLVFNNTNLGSQINGTGNSLQFSNINSSGTYSVVASNSNNCTQKMNGDIVYLINVKPKLFNISSGGSYCSGESGIPIILDGSEIGINYQLKLNNVNVGNILTGTGSLLDFGNKINSGTYTIVATNNQTNCTEVMNGLSVIKVNPLPTRFSLTGGGEYCDGENGVKIGLNSSESSVSYQLQLNGANIGSQLTGNGAAIDFGFQTQVGTYSILATNINSNCKTSMLDSKQIIKNAKPVKPLITKFGNSLVSSSNNNNQWFESNKLINGATSQTYTINKSGAYSVEVKINNCSSISDVVNAIYDSTKLTANFSGTPLKGPAPHIVQFNDWSSGSPTTWVWDFGDGYSSKIQNPKYSYANSGTYTVTLIVGKSNKYDTLTKSNYIIVDQSLSIETEENFSQLIESKEIVLYDILGRSIGSFDSFDKFKESLKNFSAPHLIKWLDKKGIYYFEKLK